MLELLVFTLVGGLVLAVVFVFGGGRALDKKRATAEADPNRALDELFAGEQVVIYESTPGRMGAETVIKGGVSRGYDLTSQAPIENPWGDSVRLVFTRRADA